MVSHTVSWLFKIFTVYRCKQASVSEYGEEDIKKEGSWSTYSWCPSKENVLVPAESRRKNRGREGEREEKKREEGGKKS